MNRSDIKFKVNKEKSLESLIYLANKNNNKINILKLIKMIKMADIYHMNKYFRPVTGDTYKKTPYGEIPVLIYDFLKMDILNLIGMNIKDYPFVIKGPFLFSKRLFNKKLFSKSDIYALNYGFKNFEKTDLNKPFNELINKKVFNELKDIDTESIVI